MCSLAYEEGFIYTKWQHDLVGIKRGIQLPTQLPQKLFPTAARAFDVPFKE